MTQNSKLSLFQTKLNLYNKERNVQEFQIIDTKFEDVERVNLDEADFKRANLKGTDFKQVDLAEPYLEKTNLKGANLEKLILRN